MDVPDHLLDLIRRIYAAPETIDGWQRLLESPSIGVGTQGALAEENEFGRCSNAGRHDAGPGEIGPDVLAALSINNNGRGQLGERELAELQALVPHVRRAVQLHQRLAAAEAARATLTSVLDASSRAVFLIDCDGRALFMNLVASRLVAHRDGLVIVDGHLRAMRAADTARLRSIVGDVTGAPRGPGIRRGSTLRLPRRSGLHPLIVFISSLRREPAIFPGVDWAVVVATKRDAVAVLDERILQVLFGLTHAEAKLTCLLAQGVPLIEAGPRLGLRRETVRTRLKDIFEKTETHRQAELVRLVLNGMPRT